MERIPLLTNRRTNNRFDFLFSTCFFSENQSSMNLSPSQQLAYSRDSPLDPRTWDLSERMASQTGLSGKNTPDVGPGSGTPPTMPHQVKSTASGGWDETDME